MPSARSWTRPQRESRVKDLLYIALTIVVFGALLLYVRACAALAASDADAEAGGTR